MSPEQTTTPPPSIPATLVWAIEAIKSVGFPIVAYGMLLWMGWQIGREFLTGLQANLNRLTQLVDDQGKILNKIADRLERLDKK